MKIYADENVEHSIVEGLCRRNVEIVSARELGHIGLAAISKTYLLATFTL